MRAMVMEGLAGGNLWQCDELDTLACPGDGCRGCLRDCLS